MKSVTTPEGAVPMCYGEAESDQTPLAKLTGGRIPIILPDKKYILAGDLPELDPLPTQHLLKFSSCSLRHPVHPRGPKC
jgi:hypothetical protein